jgi:ribosomal protein S18 acetylase RimI-like enzyme
MEIKQVKRIDLTKEQKGVVQELMLDLWGIEEPFLSHIPEQYGGLEYMLISCFNRLDDILLGYVDGELIGFLGNQVDHHNEVEKLVIKEEHRGKGYGRCLIHAFKLMVEKPMFVLIAPGNVNASKFYRAVGFNVEDKTHSTPSGIEHYQLGVLEGVLVDA